MTTDDINESSGTEINTAAERTGMCDLRKTSLAILSTLFVLLVAAFLINIFTKETIRPTITYSSEIMGSVDFAGVEGGMIQANEVFVPLLITVKLHIRNTSDKTAIDIPIHVQLVESREDFTVIAFGHKTTPDKEFGAIKTEKPDEEVLVFNYEILKPNDQDEVLFVVSGPPEIELFTKADVNLSEECWYTNKSFLFVLTFAVLAVGLLLIIFVGRKKK